MSYDHWKTTNPDDEFLGPESFDDNKGITIMREPNKQEIAFLGFLIRMGRNSDSKHQLDRKEYCARQWCGENGYVRFSNGDWDITDEGIDIYHRYTTAKAYEQVFIDKIKIKELEARSHSIKSSSLSSSSEASSRQSAHTDT